MALIVLPDLLIDRTYFHSASLRRVDERTKEQAAADKLKGITVPLESMPLILQITVVGPKDLHNTMIQGNSEQETKNMFTEILAQIATIDGQTFPDLKDYPGPSGAHDTTAGKP